MVTILRYWWAIWHFCHQHLSSVNNILNLSPTLSRQLYVANITVAIRSQSLGNQGSTDHNRLVPDLLDLVFLSPTSVNEVDVAAFLCGNFENYDHIVFTRIHDKCSVIVNCLNLWLSVISHFNYLRFTTFSFLQVQCNMSPLCGDNLRGITIIMVRDLITNIQTLFGPVDRGWITLLTLIQVLSYENHKSPRKKGWRSLKIILYKYISLYILLYN